MASPCSSSGRSPAYAAKPTTCSVFGSRREYHSDGVCRIGSWPVHGHPAPADGHGRREGHLGSPDGHHRAAGVVRCPGRGGRPQAVGYPSAPGSSGQHHRLQQAGRRQHVPDHLDRHGKLHGGGGVHRVAAPEDRGPLGRQRPERRADQQADQGLSPTERYHYHQLHLPGGGPRGDGCHRVGAGHEGCRPRHQHRLPRDRRRVHQAHGAERDHGSRCDRQ